MVEITHGGLWFSWVGLDRRSKWLAASSLLSAAAAALPFGIASGRIPFSWLASQSMTPGALAPDLALVAVALMLLSALLWWRFSLRQDEMYNRIQNWALGMGGGWTAAIMTCWAMLSLSGALPPVRPLPLISLFWWSVLVFWFVAVRRWAV